jgi:GH24 family phage-related lysozyme (muramidase)
MASPIPSITQAVSLVQSTLSSFLNSLLSVFNSFTLSVTGGFLTIPITQVNIGASLNGMLNALSHPDSSGNFQIGQAYGGSNTLVGPSYTQAPTYQPGNTTPPKVFPTSQAGGYTVPLGLNPASMYHLSAEGLRVLQMFEQLHNRAYVINGQAYIGYGHQISSYDPNMYVSNDQALTMLQADVLAAEGQVKGAISGQITQGQFDAMVDFAFTTTNFGGSAVAQKMSAGDIPGAMTALGQACYVQANNVVSRSLHLTSRRAHNIHWMAMPVNLLPPS